MKRLLLLGVLAGCPKQQIVEQPPLDDQLAVVSYDVRGAMIAELQDEILRSYERDEPPEIESSMIAPSIGTVRIGAGPGDVLVNEELARAPSRWPLDVSPTNPAEARSKRLEIHLAQDSSAAWVSDEVSWRISACGRVAVIPLRMTALYARDGDRWVLAFEHLSFGRTPTPVRDGTLRGRTLKDARSNADLHDDLSRVLAPVLARSIDKNPSAMATGPDAILIGPDISDEWQGPAMLQAHVAAGNLRAEDRRVGVVGRKLATATIAYWVGNFVADLPARPGVAPGKVRLRGTFVFERRRLDKADTKGRGPSAKTCQSQPDDGYVSDAVRARRDGCKWMLVQGHVSQPIDDGPDPDPAKRGYLDLAGLVFGTSLISPKPLELTCDDGGRSRASVPPLTK